MCMILLIIVYTILIIIYVILVIIFVVYFICVLSLICVFIDDSLIFMLDLINFGLFILDINKCLGIVNKVFLNLNRNNKLIIQKYTIKILNNLTMQLFHIKNISHLLFNHKLNLQILILKQMNIIHFKYCLKSLI